jgi:hypothetical protein
MAGAKSNVIVQKAFQMVLTLDEDEVRMLKGMVQNPYHPDETQKEADLRATIHNAIFAMGVM